MNALYYPFHLCHERTLHRLVEDYDVVHFRDFMALQLTPFMGTTAFPDRMGDYYPELLAEGRIIQGHTVNGPMDTEIVAAVNRDLADSRWRGIFHEALQNDYRFQRGLFGVAQLSREQDSKSDDSSVLSQFTSPAWRDRPYQVKTVKDLSRRAFTEEDGPAYEYGWALIKTTASLVYTIRLCETLKVVAATDSSAHSQLLTCTCQREGRQLTNSCISREGY